MPRWGEGSAHGVDYGAVGAAGAGLGVAGFRTKQSADADRVKWTYVQDASHQRRSIIEDRMSKVKAARKAHKPIPMPRAKVRMADKALVGLNAKIGEANANRLSAIARGKRGRNMMVAGAAALPVYAAGKHALKDLRPRKVEQVNAPHLPKAQDSKAAADAYRTPIVNVGAAKQRTPTKKWRKDKSLKYVAGASRDSWYEPPVVSSDRAAEVLRRNTEANRKAAS